MSNIEQVLAELDTKIPRDVIEQRDSGNGRKLSYLTGWYIIDRLNKVFGAPNWAYSSEANQIYTGQDDKKRYVASYLAKVRLVVQFPDGSKTEYVDYGYGDGIDKTSPGKCHELAVKESVTDGLKRCAKNLGMSFGLALYDKTQENVSDEPSTAETKEESPVEKKVSSINGRETVLKLISATSKVILDRELATQESLVNLLGTKYGVETKDQLTMEAAEKLLTELKGMIK